MIHKLKTLPAFYADVECGVKTFDIRKNDRNFRVGDALILEEYDIVAKKFSGNSLKEVMPCDFFWY